jgi:hypothetical protein
MMDILKIIVWYVLNVDHDVKLARMKQINVYPVMKVNLETSYLMLIYANVYLVILIPSMQHA